MNLLFYKKFTFMKKVFFLLSFFILINPLFAAEIKQATVKDEWQITTANISLVRNETTGLKTEGTVLDQLLTLNKRTLWSLQEVNSTIVLTMIISYKPIGQNNTIKQIGFYRTCNLELQNELANRGVLNNPIQAEIGYLKNNPLIIRFYNQGSLIDVPPLIANPT